MQGMRNVDRFGQFVVDCVVVVGERIQPTPFDAGGEAGDRCIWARKRKPFPTVLARVHTGVDHTRGVAGVVHVSGMYAGLMRIGLGPDLHVNGRTHPPPRAGQLLRFAGVGDGLKLSHCDGGGLQQSLHQSMFRSKVNPVESGVPMGSAIGGVIFVAD